MKDAEQSSCYIASFPLFMSELWQSVRLSGTAAFLYFKGTQSLWISVGWPSRILG